MEIKEGDLVKHKTIHWINKGNPFRVIKIEEGKAFCEYDGRDSIKYFHEFELEQLIAVTETDEALETDISPYPKDNPKKFNANF